MWIQKYISIVQKQIQIKFNKKKFNNCVEKTLIKQLLTIFTIINFDLNKCDNQNKRNCY